MKTTVSLRDLVAVPDLYPREQLDHDRVAWMRDILYAGGDFPPIVIDPGNRIVDGAHRAAALRIVKGNAAGVVCEVREYASDAEFLLDAIKLNAGHGKPLGHEDRARCVALAQKHSVTVAQLASVLNVRADRVKSLAQSWPTAAAKPATTVVAKPARNQPTAGRARHWQNGAPVMATGLDLLNRILVALREGDIDVRDREIRQTVRALVKVALERLKETEETA